MFKKKILVIDDDTDILKVVTLLLQMKGFEVLTFNDAHNILSNIETIQPDAILLDVQLGSSDGRHVCKQIKEVESFCHIPVILFSANNDYSNDVATCLADDFIEKPFDIHFFLNKIAHYTQNSVAAAGC